MLHQEITGRDKQTTHPIVAPVLHGKGCHANARATFVSSVSSPMMLLMTPMLPLSAPLRERETTRPAKVRERPKQYMERERPRKPVRMMGLRPKVSEARDQSRTVRPCVAKKMDCCGRWSVC